MAFFSDLDLEKRDWQNPLAGGFSQQSNLCNRPIATEPNLLMVATPISCNLWLYPRTLNELSATYLQTLWETHTLVSILGSQKPQGCWAINNTVIPDSRKSGLGPAHLSSERRATFSAFTHGLAGRACGWAGLWEAPALLYHLWALPFLPLDTHWWNSSSLWVLLVNAGCYSHHPRKTKEAAILDANSKNPSFCFFILVWYDIFTKFY